MKKINDKLKGIPSRPGVYFFKKAQEVIYVGKAKNLKNRISSYFQKTARHHKPEMMSKITNFDYIITSSETEAIFLEANLIKKYKPKYNVILKDDKNFIYIKITKEDFPLITTGRKIIKDKAKYFGPYISAKAARATLNILRRIFPFRACRTLPKRPCLLFHLGYCPAPCDNKIKKGEYKKSINKIIQFLRGNLEGIYKDLKAEMEKAAEAENFEKAAILRDQVFSLETIMEKQKIISPKNVSQDVLSLARKKDTAAINLFIIRAGKVIDKKSFSLNHTAKLKPEEIFYSFINQYYSQTPDKPKELILPLTIPEEKTIIRAFGFDLKRAQRGKKFGLLRLGTENALQYLKIREKSEKEERSRVNKALLQLKRELDLKKNPERIEAYDISNIQGINPVGSMVVFKKGRADKSDYRKFRIKSVVGANDVAMIAEVLERRLLNKDWPKPDLIILDGGKGQLNAGLKVLKRLKEKIPIVAIAKKLEEIYRPERKAPLILPVNSPSFYLVQNIRDEAHRFAIGYFRKKHDKESYKSVLDEIPRLGPKTKRKLILAFGSLDKIRKAKDKEIEDVVGKKLTKILKENI